MRLGGLGGLKSRIQHNPSHPFVTDSVTDFRSCKSMKYMKILSYLLSIERSVTRTPTRADFVCEGVDDGFP